MDAYLASISMAHGEIWGDIEAIGTFGTLADAEKAVEVYAAGRCGLWVISRPRDWAKWNGTVNGPEGPGIHHW